MDSLTQIVLGAAVGEAVLGRKIGNRAMVWGAIGGTIPDLDVMANLFMGELDALSAHRGFTHSIFFSVFAPLAFAWLVTYIYRSGTYRSSGYKLFISTINIVILFLITVGIYRATDGSPVSLFAAAVAGFLAYRLFKFYALRSLRTVDASFRDWYLLFTLAFLTHILLDCFTTYGTQVYLPFSNARVAWNTISVADPAYTLPFLLCLAIAAFLPQASRSRAIFNWLGIGLSSAYLLFTVINRANIDRVFETALHNRGLETTRHRVNPTILQNILWNCIAESDTAFHIGLYSMYDTDPNLHMVNALPKDREAIKTLTGSHEYEVLTWFSDGYLYVVPTDSTFELFDLRFGVLTDTITSNSDFIFRFELTPEEDGYAFRQLQESTDEDLRTLLSRFVERVKGY